MYTIHAHIHTNQNSHKSGKDPQDFELRGLEYK